MISIIVAHDSNRAIGAGNQLLWHISEDLKYFKRVTTGKTVIMGKNTFESIGRPLPKRTNIVVSRTMQPVDGIVLERELEPLLKKFAESEEEVMVMGGGKIYAQSLQYARRLYITEVDAAFEKVDTYFPDYSDFIARSEMEATDWMLDEKSGLRFRFVTYTLK